MLLFSFSSPTDGESEEGDGGAYGKTGSMEWRQHYTAEELPHGRNSLPVVYIV